MIIGIANDGLRYPIITTEDDGLRAAIIVFPDTTGERSAIIIDLNTDD